MSYRITEVQDERTWEAFLVQLKPHTFLQAWKWGLQYELSGSKIFRLGIWEENVLVGVALLLKITARRGSFLLCPHGPLLLDAATQLSPLVEYLVSLAKKEHCDFIRVCPLALASTQEKSLYQKRGFRDAPIHMHPELSWMLSLEPSEEELLKEMRKTTRYLIKKTEKEGVEIEMSTNPKDIDRFWPVYQATVDRQHFTPFTKSYLQQEFALFSKEGEAAFFFGTYQGKVIAAAIIIFYNGSAFYHHSGSVHLFKNINASYLLQWRVIQEAKKRGCLLYNFWGIAPEDRPNHPWAGLSLFKKGFGGFAEEYLHAQDLPLTLKYRVNYVVETARRLRRHL